MISLDPRGSLKGGRWKVEGGRWTDARMRIYSMLVLLVLIGSTKLCTAERRKFNHYHPELPATDTHEVSFWSLSPFKHVRNRDDV